MDESVSTGVFKKALDRQVEILTASVSREAVRLEGDALKEHFRTALAYALKGGQFLESLQAVVSEAARARLKNVLSPSSMEAITPEEGEIPVPMEFFVGMSVRARRALVRTTKASTMEQLAALTAEKLEGVKNCGDTTVHEIRTRLLEIGITLPER